MFRLKFSASGLQVDPKGGKKKRRSHLGGPRPETKGGKKGSPRVKGRKQSEKKKKTCKLGGYRSENKRENGPSARGKPWEKKASSFDQRKKIEGTTLGWGSLMPAPPKDPYNRTRNEKRNKSSRTVKRLGGSVIYAVQKIQRAEGRCN